MGVCPSVNTVAVDQECGSPHKPPVKTRYHEHLSLRHRSALDGGLADPAATNRGVKENLKMQIIETVASDNFLHNKTREKEFKCHLNVPDLRT